MPDEEKNMPQEENGGGAYKKRGWGFWLLVYLIIAIVVYGVIYYVIKARQTSTQSGTKAPTKQSIY